MNALVDVLRVIDAAIERAADEASEHEMTPHDANELRKARGAIVHLMAAAESTIITHARVNTATVAGRRELGPRVRHLRAMLEKAGRRVEGIR